LLCYKHFFNDETVFIGHSLGASFVANFIAKNELKAKKLILVSGLYQNIGIKEFDDLNQTFFKKPKMLLKLKSQVKNIEAIFGNDDPYLTQEILNDFADLCGAKKTIITGGGHLNEASGYLAFPLLIDIIAH
jgi:predicted alpha/beta hydrolase family esterase